LNYYNIAKVDPFFINRNKGPCSYVFPELMTHNNFNLYNDIIYPLKNALENKFTCAT